MDGLIIAAIAIVWVVLVAALVPTMLRRRREFADLGVGEVREEGLGLPFRATWQVRAAVRAGRAVRDPALAGYATRQAELAVRLGEHTISRARRLRWVSVSLSVVWTAAAVFVVIDGGFQWTDLAVVAGYAVMVGLFLGAVPLARRSIRRARAAAAANQELAAAHPDAAWTGRRLSPRRSAWIRGVASSLVTIVVGTPLYYGGTRALGQPIGWGGALAWSLPFGLVFMPAMQWLYSGRRASR